MNILCSLYAGNLIYFLYLLATVNFLDPFLFIFFGFIHNFQYLVNVASFIFLLALIFIVYVNRMDLLTFIGFICFIFVSASVIFFLCFLFFDYDKLKKIYKDKRDKKLSFNEMSEVKGVFACSIFFVLAIILYVTFLLYLNTQQAHTIWFAFLTFVIIYFCSFLILINIMLITEDESYQNSFNTIFIINLVIFLLISVYLSYNKNNQEDTPSYDL